MTSSTKKLLSFFSTSSHVLFLYSCPEIGSKLTKSRKLGGFYYASCILLCRFFLSFSERFISDPVVLLFHVVGTVFAILLPDPE